MIENVSILRTIYFNLTWNMIYNLGYFYLLRRKQDEATKVEDLEKSKRIEL